MTINFVDPSEADFITHSGKFHADDVMAAAILEKTFKNINLARVGKIEDAGDISNKLVFDIGDGDFDHHQKSKQVFHKTGEPYASSGLIWRAFGQYLCNDRSIANYVMDNVIKSIDAIDNGVNVSGDSCRKTFTFSKAISFLNPIDVSDEKESNKCFLEAVKIASIILDSAVLKGVEYERAFKSVKKQLESNTAEHYLFLNKYLPWEKAVCSLESGSNIAYIIFPSCRGGFNVQPVPITEDSVTQRIELPEEWLSCPNNVPSPGVSFVHKDGILINCDTIENAIKFIDTAFNQGKHNWIFV